jgi:hypothetical protein
LPEHRTTKVVCWYSHLTVRNREIAHALALVALGGVSGLAATACTPLSSASLSAAARPARETLRSMRDPQWVSIAKSRQAELLVERVLYEKPGAPHFFVHVRVVNETASALGVDLRSYGGVYYPSQWGPSRTPRREVIDERRLASPPLDAAAQAEIFGDFGAGLLTRIPVRGSVDYYRDFNASSRADVEAQSRSGRYLIVVMDGRLDVADDANAERILPPQDDSAREVALEVPVRWAQVPAGAIVLADK